MYVRPLSAATMGDIGVTHGNCHLTRHLETPGDSAKIGRISGAYAPALSVISVTQPDLSLFSTDL